MGKVVLYIIRVRKAAKGREYRAFFLWLWHKKVHRVEDLRSSVPRFSFRRKFEFKNSSFWKNLVLLYVSSVRTVSILRPQFPTRWITTKKICLHLFANGQFHCPPPPPSPGTSTTFPIRWVKVLLSTFRTNIPPDLPSPFPSTRSGGFTPTRPNIPRLEHRKIFIEEEEVKGEKKFPPISTLSATQ